MSSPLVFRYEHKSWPPVYIHTHKYTPAIGKGNQVCSELYANVMWLLRVRTGFSVSLQDTWRPDVATSVVLNLLPASERKNTWAMEFVSIHSFRNRVWTLSSAQQGEDPRDQTPNSWFETCIKHRLIAQFSSYSLQDRGPWALVPKLWCAHRIPWEAC